MLETLFIAVLYATLGGITIPIGGLLAQLENIRPHWLEKELRHSVIAFGGGVLFAAIALVLVPEGTRHLSLGVAVLAFGLGGFAFMIFDRNIEKNGSSASQLMAMVADFVPEAMAMGALLASGEPAGPLLALLIALQNLPEGFNAYRELLDSTKLKPRTIILLFCCLALCGPIAAALGVFYLSNAEHALAFIMMFAAGGIMYLSFEDIAPQARLEKSWAPPLGAVCGFMLGLAGQALT